MHTLVAIWLGAGIGATARYFATIGLAAALPGFPWGTLVVNAAGSIIIGALWPFTLDISSEWRGFVITGFLGALTTFSTFSVDLVALVHDKRWQAATFYWALHVFICVGLCFLAAQVAAKFHN
jgi:CrcB protein